MNTEKPALAQDRYHGLLLGSSHGRLLVSLNDKTAFEASQRMVKEFGFTLTSLPFDPTLEYKHFEYYQEFRVFCCSDKYGGKNDYDNIS